MHVNDLGKLKLFNFSIVMSQTLYAFIDLVRCADIENKLENTHTYNSK